MRLLRLWPVEFCLDGYEAVLNYKSILLGIGINVAITDDAASRCDERL